MELIPESRLRAMSIGESGIANQRTTAAKTSEVDIVNPWLTVELQRLFGDTQQ